MLPLPVPDGLKRLGSGSFPGPCPSDAGLLVGLQTDVPFRAQYEWLSTWGLEGATVRNGRVAEMRLGQHDGFYLINRRIRATFEHRFLVRRDEEWGFCSAELLEVGATSTTSSKSSGSSFSSSGESSVVISNTGESTVG